MKVRYLKTFVAGLPNTDLLKEFSKDPKSIEFIHDPALSCNECYENAEGYDSPAMFLLKHVAELLEHPINFNKAISGIYLPEGENYSYSDKGESIGDYKFFETLKVNHYEFKTSEKSNIDELVELINSTGCYVGVGKFKALELIKLVMSESTKEWQSLFSDEKRKHWKPKMIEFVEKCEKIEPLREEFCKAIGIDKINLKNLKDAIAKKPKVTPGIISQYRKKNIFNKMEEKEFFDDEKIL